MGWFASAHWMCRWAGVSRPLDTSVREMLVEELGGAALSPDTPQGKTGEAQGRGLSPPCSHAGGEEVDPAQDTEKESQCVTAEATRSPRFGVSQ